MAIQQENLAMLKVAESINTMTIKELDYLHKCTKSYEFSQLGINRKGFEKDAFVSEAISIMKKLLLTYSSHEIVIRKLKEVFEEGYKREWFLYDTQFIANKERDFKRLERIIYYIYENNYKVYYVDYPINVIMDREHLEYKNFVIKAINDKADLVIGKGEERIIVKIYSGAPEYSYQARNERNKVINSISLLVSYLGTYYRFSDYKIKVASWYLKNKDDKGNELIDRFDHKPGKNIIEFDYSSMGVEIVQKLLHHVLNFPEKGIEKCSLCFNKSLCKMKKRVRVDSISDVTKKPVKKLRELSLTESQKQVVEHMDGPMSVIAVPGAGKTFSLVNRLVYLIQRGVDPSNILFVTFTKKAAKEIESRVSSSLLAEGIDCKMPIISTFNGLGFSILKENHMYVGTRVKLADDVDRLSLIRDVLSKAPRIEKMSYDGIYKEYGLLKQLDKIFEEIDEIGEDEYRNLYTEKKDVKNILIAYHLFKEEYSKNGFINYDMQISLVNKIFTKYPHLTKHYAKKFKYIMVDEFQDSSKDPVDMIYAIAKHHNNIIIVGDDDQSIYGFRGGSNKFMFHFKDDFPSAKLVYMEDNFRSNDRILKSSSALINNNKDRFNKTFIHHKKSEFKPIYLKGCSINFIPDLIKQVISKGYSAGDIAIIARNNKRLAEIQEVLEDYISLSAPKDYLIEDTIFMAIYDILNLYYNGLDDDESFYRYLAYHNNEKGLMKRDKKKSFYTNLVESEKLLPIDIKDITCLPKYREYASKSMLMREGYRLISCFKSIQYAKGATDALQKIVQLMYGFSEHKVIDALTDMADERAIVTTKDLYELMTKMLLFGVNIRVGYDASKDSVNLLTAHDSKGKEFKVVIIFAMEDFKDEEEEIRLLYVAQTRAMNTLFMVETPYNHCDVLKYFQDEVIIKKIS